MTETAGDYWIVVQVQGGREIEMRDFLECCGIECYVPRGRRIVRTHWRRHRTVEQKFVVLPNYVFMRIDPEVPGWGALDPECCPVPAQVLMAPGNAYVDPRPGRLPSGLVDKWRRNERDGLYDEAFGRRAVFHAGARVAVTGGRLQGLAGSIERLKGLRVAVTWVEQKKYELDIDILEPLGL